MGRADEVIREVGSCLGVWSFGSAGGAGLEEGREHIRQEKGLGYRQGRGKGFGDRRRAGGGS